MYKRDLPPTELLNHLFRYDPETGELFWRNPTHARCTKGPIRTSDYGYLSVCIKGVAYKQHRIIWAMQTGSVPENMEVDHINHDRSDNRWCNLQLLTPSENNRKKPAVYKRKPLEDRKPRKLQLSRYPSGKCAVLGWDHVKQRHYTITTLETEAQALEYIDKNCPRKNFPRPK